MAKAFGILTPKSISTKKERMIGTDRIFFDTAPFIYLVENHPKYYPIVSDFISNKIAVSEFGFVTSAITLAEFEVKPKRNNQLSIIEKFRTKLKELDFVLAEINFDIAELSTTLRVNYSFLKLFDSLQLATAINMRCQSFYTNDFRLKQVGEIEVILVEDLN